jgi:hypothetical protein
VEGDAVATALRTEWTRLNHAVSDLGTTTTGEQKI